MRKGNRNDEEGSAAAIKERVASFGKSTANDPSDDIKRKYASCMDLRIFTRLRSYIFSKTSLGKKGVYTDRKNTDKSQSHRCFSYPCRQDCQSQPFFQKIDNFLSMLVRKCLDSRSRVNRSVDQKIHHPLPTFPLVD